MCDHQREVKSNPEKVGEMWKGFWNELSPGLPWETDNIQRTLKALHTDHFGWRAHWVPGTWLVHWLKLNSTRHQKVLLSGIVTLFHINGCST